jgi:outer membrane protein
MRLNRQPLFFALLLAGLSSTANATDLMQAYQMARQSDPQLAAAEANKNAVKEGVVQSRSALLPQVNATYTLTDSDADSRNRGFGANLNQSIYDRSDYTRLGASKARAKQADADYDSANDGLIVRTADAYFDVLTAIQSLSSSRAEERAVKRQLDLAEKRLEVGLAPITDVHEARARYDIARANTINAANTLDDSREALAEITGAPANNIQGLAANYQPKNENLQTLDYWVEQAKANNPVLESRRQALAVAEKEVSTARAGHLPSVSATATYNDRTSWLSGGGNSAFNDRSNSDTIGVTVSIPVFSGFATQSRVRQALYQRDAAKEGLEQQDRAITRQTRNAYRSLQAGEAEVEARRLAVVSAKAAYEAGEAGLEVGTRTIVDVLIAQQQLFQAERDYARARHGFLVNTLRLKQAAGTLEVSDLEAVNRVLVENAEAKLAQ